MIDIRNLSKSFGKVQAVRDVTFSAPDGAVTGLLGANGAGKTTTLRMLSGLMKPDAGSLSVDGIDVGAQPLAAQARMGMLPDARGIYPRLTPREHIHYFGQLQGLAGERLAASTEALIEKLGLREIADRRAEGFSQGERTKVALARALVHNPRNVILDEPTNGLDIMSTRATRELIRRLRNEGCCVVFSSHIMQEVSALCDRIVVIAQGAVVAAGTPAELRAQTGCDSLEDAFVRLAGLADDTEEFSS
ncbi:MAG: ATP-binding cassette domain-containing protein [Acidobacteriota bacterium]|jgi:sodium transport system ATP-binding protein|nr:ATP-binding cassette domain-containing protein [Bryobacteraceae bacterium CoA2 C42]MCA2965173.1 ATP-binding cassette domain-containing protein [Acidobacteriaceae bacterium]